LISKFINSVIIVSYDELRQKEVRHTMVTNQYMIVQSPKTESATCEIMELKTNSF